MRKLVWDTSFRRAFRRRTHNETALQERILRVLDRLARDPFSPPLKVHKLSGQLKGLWACWVEYDCRIIFVFDPDPCGEEDRIVLIDLGGHDEVY